jgi:hypothetical protein
VRVNQPRPLLSGDDPTEGTIGPVVSTIVVIAILIAGAVVAIQGIVDRVQERRAIDEATSSALPANVQAQSVTIE